MSLGVIFDLDGTLVDSLAYYRETWTELILEAGLDHDPELYLRRPTRENFRVLHGELEEHEVEARAAQQAERGRAKMQARGVVAHPGMVTLVQELHARGVRLALATAAERSNAAWMLEELGVRELFDAVVVDRDVPCGKPAADIYLAAQQLLAVPVKNCCVIEDSTAAIRSARNAGFCTIGIATTHPPHELQDAGAAFVVTDTTMLTAAVVMNWIERWNTLT